VLFGIHDEATAGIESTTDAYVIVHSPITALDPNVVPVNVHLNHDAP
jgi:hypothetical protein